jgi:DHA2 family multidrug resistance protein
MAREAAESGNARQDTTEHGLRLVLVVAGVMAASLMQTLDSTITNVALPTIQGNLGASQDEATWVITAYTIAAIVVIPITPFLQTRFGRRNYFVASILGFTIASVACGAASDLNFLIAWRFIQGAFGGGLLATAQAILRDSFPPKQLGASQGIFALGAIMGPALGPPLGGVLVDNASWNWVFDINVVPGIVAAGLMFTLLKDPSKPQKTNLDIVGLVLLAAGLGAMQYVLTEGERHYWFADDSVLACAIVSAVSLIAFVWYELAGTATPIVDLRIFKNRSVAAGTGLALALGAVLYGSTYTLPQFTQGALGFTPTESGQLFILRAVPIALLTFPIVRLASKVDTRILLGIGFALVALGSVLQAFITTEQASFWTFALSLVVAGMGLSCLFVPLSIAVLGATTPQDGPKAGAMVNLALQLGGSIAIAALDVLIDLRWSFHSIVLGGAATLSNPAVEEFLQRGSVAQLSRIVNGQAAIEAYADATFAVAFVAAICLPLIFLMRKPKAAGGPAQIGG